MVKCADHKEHDCVGKGEGPIVGVGGKRGENAGDGLGRTNSARGTLCLVTVRCQRGGMLPLGPDQGTLDSLLRNGFLSQGFSVDARRTQTFLE